MDPDKNAVGSRIKSIRQAKGLTLENFGEFIDGASKGLVGNWEKGVNLPNNKRLKMIAQFADISVSELLYGLNSELKEKVYKYTDEIMNTEIKEMHSLKYKLLYDPTFKKETIAHLVNHYNFAELTDYGIKQYTKELLDAFLDKEIYERKYKPYSNKHATYLAYDLLKDQVMNRIDNYFSNENIKMHTDSLKDDEIKEDLSFELYEKIRIVLEDAQNKIRVIDSERS